MLLSKKLQLIFTLCASQACATVVNPLVIFAHGLGNNDSHYQSYAPHFRWPFHGFNFNDAQQLSKACLAQEADIKRLQEQVTQHPDRDIMLMGVSRGAATIFNYAGSRKLPSNVRGLILEAPFDEARAVVSQALGAWSWIPGLSHYINFVILPRLYKNYNPRGIQPILVARRIPLDLPVLIICSQQDTIIAAASSQRLYKELVKAGHTHCYLLVTEHGGHANILTSESRELYCAVVAAFYRKYMLGVDTLEDEVCLAACKAS